jgi:hypothetical protein
MKPPETHRRRLWLWRLGAAAGVILLLAGLVMALEPPRYVASTSLIALEFTNLAKANLMTRELQSKVPGVLHAETKQTWFNFSGHDGIPGRSLMGFSVRMLLIEDSPESVRRRAIEAQEIYRTAMTNLVPIESIVSFGAGTPRPFSPLRDFVLPRYGPFVSRILPDGFQQTMWKRLVDAVGDWDQP